MDYVVPSVNPVREQVSSSAIIRFSRRERICEAQHQNCHVRANPAKRFPPKSSTLLLLAFLFLSGQVHALTLAWDAVTNTVVTGYYLYLGTSSRSYTVTNDIGNATQTSVSGLTAGSNYFFAVTAHNASGLQSDYSAEISYTVPVSNSTLPSVTLTSPSNGAVYIAPLLMNLGATVAANGHSIRRVQFYRGTNMLGQDASSPYSLTWSNSNPGTFNLRARLLYDSTNTIDSVVASVTILAAASPAQLYDPHFTPLGFQITIGWTLGQAYRIQRSPDFVNWTDVLSRTALESIYIFTDPSIAGTTRNSYRVVSP